MTLYELLTLRPAFTGKDRQEILRQIAFEEPKPPRVINKSIPHELETIVLKAMSKSPDERYATAQEVAEDLRRFLEHKPIQARRPTPVQRFAATPTCISSARNPTWIGTPCCGSCATRER